MGLWMYYRAFRDAKIRWSTRFVRPSHTRWVMLTASAVMPIACRNGQAVVCRRPSERPRSPAAAARAANHSFGHDSCRLIYRHIPAYNSAPCAGSQESSYPIERAICSEARALGDEFHGYQMAKRLQEVGDSRLLIAHGTLYRALSRLEDMGLLKSHWEDPRIPARENRPGRRLYLADGARRNGRSRHDHQSRQRIA